MSLLVSCALGALLCAEYYALVRTVRRFPWGNAPLRGRVLLALAAICVASSLVLQRAYHGLGGTVSSHDRWYIDPTVLLLAFIIYRNAWTQPASDQGW